MFLLTWVTHNNSFPFLSPLFSLDDVTQAIADAVTTDGKTFDITVSRQNMLERGLMQWQSPKKTSPTDQLKVSFLGGAGIDTGVLCKEFLTGMCRIQKKKCHHHNLKGYRVSHKLYFKYCVYARYVIVHFIRKCNDLHNSNLV